VKLLFDGVRGLNDFVGRPSVDALLLAVGALVGSKELCMPTIPFTSDGKKGMCVCFGGDATVNFLLFVGRVATVKAEIAPVSSVQVLCGTGSFGHNLVVTGLEKLHIVCAMPVLLSLCSTCQNPAKIIENSADIMSCWLNLLAVGPILS